MKKVGLISLGCAKNLVDSENILGVLKQEDYEITSSMKDADIIIVNTCGFITSSKKESIETIFEALEYGKKVVVTGCLVQRYEKELRSEIPEVDQFIPISSYEEFLSLFKIVDPLHTFKTKGLNDKYRIVSTGNISAYLKIGEGCDNRCTYCAIPLIRGGFVSRSQKDIINEAKKLVKDGYKELILLEQDTTKYGIDLKNGENIVGLLKELLKIDNLPYIRLLYLYPDEITDELIDLIANEPRLTSYFDIPIQHSEDKILSLMNRRGNKEYLKSLFLKIRSKIPNAILRTTVMVGFPGETHKDFENLKTFIQEISFDHLGAFSYSREEGTPSFNFEHQVSEKTKAKRLDEIMKIQQNISYKRNKKHIGEIMQGLIVGQENNNWLFRSYFNAPDDVDGKIYIKKQSGSKIKEGDIVKIEIKEAFVYDLMGEVI